jgi:hypothetical protein
MASCHEIGGGQARRGETGFCALAEAMGRGTRFRLGIAVSGLVKDYERLPDTLAGLHFVAFACLFLQQATGILGMGP